MLFMLVDKIIIILSTSFFQFYSLMVYGILFLLKLRIFGK